MCLLMKNIEILLWVSYLEQKKSNKLLERSILIVNLFAIFFAWHIIYLNKYKLCLLKTVVSCWPLTETSHVMPGLKSTVESLWFNNPLPIVFWFWKFVFEA